MKTNHLRFIAKIYPLALLFIYFYKKYLLHVTFRSLLSRRQDYKKRNNDITMMTKIIVLKKLILLFVERFFKFRIMSSWIPNIHIPGILKR